MKNFDVKKEQQDTDGSEWVFGSVSQPCLYEIPEDIREQLLPQGEVQRGVEDFSDCASRSPNNILAPKFTYAQKIGLMRPENVQWGKEKGYVVDGRWDFSDRFTAILSGTTRSGNSLKAPIDSLHRDGMIPKTMLPAGKDLTWDQYHNPKVITQEMRDLGKEFTRRFSINYEKVYQIHFKELLKEDMIAVAGYAWPTPVNGEYPKTDLSPNHAFALFRTPAYYIFDNYEEGKDDWIKKLSPDYVFFEYGYRVYVSSETVPNDTQTNALFAWLAKMIGWLTGGKKDSMPVIPPEILPDPKPVPPLSIPVDQPSDILYNVAKASLGLETVPGDADDELGCMLALNAIHKKAFGYEIGGGASTYEGYQAMLHSNKWVQIPKPEKGAVIIAPTGFGNGKIPHGHVGICGIYGIMSNDSKTGKWTQNYSYDAWESYYGKIGGYVSRYFRRV